AEVATVADERLVHEALGHDDMRQRIEDGDVGSGPEGEVIIGLDVRALDQVGPARIDDNEARPGAQALLEARSKDWMSVGRVRPDDDDHVRLADGLEILR